MLSCGDLTRSLAFYGDLLGGVETYRFPDNGEPAFIALTVGESEIGLGASQRSRRMAGNSGPRRATGWSSASTSTTSTVSSRTHGRAGFEAVADPADMPWGERTAWIADPDGNLVMLTR